MKVQIVHPTKEEFVTVEFNLIPPDPSVGEFGYSFEDIDYSDNLTDEEFEEHYDDIMDAIYDNLTTADYDKDYDDYMDALDAKYGIYN